MPPNQRKTKMRRLSFALIGLLLMTAAASADAVCLSKSEARKLWPTQHIYWYYLGRERCWSNRHGPPRNLRIDPVMGHLAQDANGSNTAKKGDRLKYVAPDEYTEELDAQAKPLPLWPPVLPLPLQQPPRFIPWEDRITGGR